jgi:hypothetical protein
VRTPVPVAGKASSPITRKDPQAAPVGAARSEVAELEDQLARDREAIKKLLSKGAGERGAWLRDPELRELSERLPRLQAEIKALRRDDEP